MSLESCVLINAFLAAVGTGVLIGVIGIVAFITFKFLKKLARHD